MNTRLDRRAFLGKVTLLPVTAAAVAGLGAGQAVAQTPIRRVGGPRLKISLNAYSFARPLNDHLRGRGQGMTLLDLLDFCAQHDFDAIDPTGYYFPGYGSIRKGNIIEREDGQLCVVLSAESFHPGKGTPTTQID